MKHYCAKPSAQLPKHMHNVIVLQLHKLRWGAKRLGMTRLDQLAARLEYKNGPGHALNERVRAAQYSTGQLDKSCADVQLIWHVAESAKSYQA